MATRGKFVRVDSHEEPALRRFVKLLHSLPSEERDLFRLYRHPAQDKGVVGYKAATMAAVALLAEVGWSGHVMSADVGADADGWLLVLKLAPQPRLSGTKFPEVHRGFSVRYQETDESNKS